MYITFSIARFNYEKLNEVLPKPTAIAVETRSIQVTYHFGQKLIGGKQIMRIGLIKKSIEAIFDDQVSWLGETLPNMSGDVYGIDAFYHSYCRYKTYPKWLWIRHRRELMSKSMWYAVRLYENGLFCFETVLGYMYLQNNRMRGKIAKFEVLEKKARWITAKMYERIDSGEFNKLDSEALKQVRTKAGKQGNKASIAVRQIKAQQRQIKVKQLLDDGCSVNEIVGRLGIPKRTVYNDLKALKVQL